MNDPYNGNGRKSPEDDLGRSIEKEVKETIGTVADVYKRQTLNSYFGYTIHNLRGKPTNSEFIAMIADKMRLDKKSHRTA